MKDREITYNFIAMQKLKEPEAEAKVKLYVNILM